MGEEIQGRTAGENRVIEALTRELGEGWDVIPSTKYLTGGKRRERLREGEFDALAFNPRHGILVLEVKGGGVRYDGHLRKWYSQSGESRWFSIKDPFEQALKAERFMMDSLTDAGVLRAGGPSLPVGGAVFFPDVRWASEDLPAHARRELILDSSHFGGLDSAVPSVLKLFRGPGFRPLPGAEAGLVRDKVLYPTCRVIPRLKSALDNEAVELLALTRRQFEILDLLEETNRVAIRGYAGTGKTLLAMEKARRLYGDGKSVALLCFNKPLGEEMARMLIAQSDRIHVRHFHRMAYELCRDAGVPFEVPPDAELASEFWNSEAPLLMMDALQKKPRRYDAVIVDEGQDFLPDWWAVIFEILTDRENGTFYVFYDPKQNIYRDKVVLPVPDSRMVLNRNCRNTRRIGELAGDFGRVRMTWSDGCVEGESPRFFATRFPEEQAEKIDALAGKLLGEEGISPEDIVCLSFRSKENSCLSDRASLAGVPLTNELLLPGGKIRFSTLHRFKGLEAAIVILCDLTSDPDKCGRGHLYVATSRARHRIFIFHDRSWKRDS